VNEEFAESYRIRTTLVDFRLDLVASRVGVFVTELGQQTHYVLYFLVVYFSCFYFSLSLDVETLIGSSQTFKTSHKTY